MANLKQTVLVATLPTPEHHRVIVYMPQSLVERVRSIGGVRHVDFDRDRAIAWLDPRYDFDEIVSEIQSLDTPIAVPVTADNTLVEETTE